MLNNCPMKKTHLSICEIVGNQRCACNLRWSRRQSWNWRDFIQKPLITANCFKSHLWNKTTGRRNRKILKTLLLRCQTIKAPSSIFKEYKSISVVENFYFFLICFHNDRRDHHVDKDHHGYYYYQMSLILMILNTHIYQARSLFILT